MDIPRDDTGRQRRRYALIGLGVAALAAVTFFVANLEPAAPSVERDVLLFGDVQRGSFVRQVRGPGTLVPERVVFVSAVAGGRVDEVMVEPGAEVARGSVLLELGNPDVELEALQAQQQLTAARASLVQLRRNLRSEVLTQEATVADAEATAAEARRQAAADSALVERELISRNEASRTAEEARAARIRLETERRRLELLEETVDEEIGVQEEQVERLRSIQAYQRRRVESMTVRAPADGVLQDLNLEVGQWVQSGTTLARVAQPGRLKAEIRIPESQARDVQIGQEALVDLRTDSVPGRVRRVDPNVQNGSVLVEVTLEEELPPGARPDLSVDGTVVIERLEDVLHVERPAYGQSNATVSLFRVADGGDAAERVTVRLGRSSVNRIEVVDGLREGDRIILTDMSRWDDTDRVRIE
jgi:multidrug resistance efflux pump